jgi:hypothetical protein
MNKPNPSMTIGSEAAGFKELFLEWEYAVAHAGTMLRAYGMQSRQFLEADQAATDIWHRLQEMQRSARKHGIA